MGDTLFLKPAPGLAVLDPATRKPLPPEGRAVPDDTYWRRRLRDGDAILSDPPAPEPQAASTQAADSRSRKSK